MEIAWAFPETEENWKKYVELWQKANLNYHPLATKYAHRNYPKIQRLLTLGCHPSEYNEARDMIDETKNKIGNAIDKMQPYKRFFMITNALSRESFFSLKGEFARWALTKLLPIEVTIADQIDPRIFSEVASLMLGMKEKEGEEIESSVD